MDRFDLTTVEGRLALVNLVFTYPAEPHRRKHGPRGYEDYEAYRDWLRDEFSYRCAFSLLRESWGFSFHIDHLISQKERPDLICEYDNLIYMWDKLNLSKGKKRLPDPCEDALGDCLFVHVHGERIGEIEAKNKIGEKIIRILKLDHKNRNVRREQWIRILRSVAQTDELLFKELVGYPENLPDLNSKGKGKTFENTKPDGLKLSAQYLKEHHLLPEWI